VDTSVALTVVSSQTYAVYAMIDPNVIRYSSDSHDFALLAPSEM